MAEALGGDDSFHRNAAAEVEMTSLRPSVLMGTLVLCASLLGAAELSSYRGFQFGSTLEIAAKQAGVQLSEVKVLHRRPAVIQELEWRPRFPYKANTAQLDPVRDSLLRFYNGELFQIVTTYDRDKVRGITEADMVTALSSAYGTASKPAVEIPYHSNYGESARVIARWEDSEYSYNLIRTGDQTSFALVLSGRRLNALAQAAVAEALRLDALEAPQREVELQRIEDAKEQGVLDKARSANLPNFRP